MPNQNETNQKADFTDIYTRPDPRAYYDTLAGLGYRIPEHGRNVFDALVDELRGDGREVTILDLCCSYGVNAALLNHEITLADLERHYAEGNDLSVEELIERDRAWFASRRRPDPVDVIGLDTSVPAVEYATGVGLLSWGMAIDLEQRDVPASQADRIDDVDLVTVTGGVGYIGGETFDRVLEACDTPPWVAALSLRWVDFSPVSETLAEHGLVTEKLDSYVVAQRRFADADEEQFVLDELASHGVAPTRIEQSGQHAAELFVARPADEVANASIEQVLADVI